MDKVLPRGRRWFAENIDTKLWDKDWNEVPFIHCPNVFPTHSACDVLALQCDQALALSDLLP